MPKVARSVTAWLGAFPTDLNFFETTIGRVSKRGMRWCNKIRHQPKFSGLHPQTTPLGRKCVMWDSDARPETCWLRAFDHAKHDGVVVACTRLGCVGAEMPVRALRVSNVGNLGHGSRRGF